MLLLMRELGGREAVEFNIIQAGKVDGRRGRAQRVVDSRPRSP